MHQFKTKMPLEQLYEFASSVSRLSRFVEEWDQNVMRDRSAMQQERFSLAGCHQIQQTPETSSISLHGLKSASSAINITVFLCHGNCWNSDFPDEARVSISFLPSGFRSLFPPPSCFDFTHIYILVN